MSNFNCGTCGKHLADTPKGYITGCEHYPADKSAVDYYIKIYMSEHVSQVRLMDGDFQDNWHIGAQLWKDREAERNTKNPELMEAESE